MKNLSEKLNDILDGNFSTIRIDDTYDAINAIIGQADEILDEDTIQDCQIPIEDNTNIVKFLTEDDEVFLFKEEDILNGNIEEGTTIIAQDIDEIEHKLKFFQERAVQLSENLPATIILANNDAQHVLTQLPYETYGEYQIRIKKTVDSLAKEDFQKNKSNIKNDKNWHTYQVPHN